VSIPGEDLADDDETAAGTAAGIETTNALCDDADLSQDAFFDAAERGDRDEIRRHLAARFDVDATDAEDGYTALLLASECGHVGVVEELVSAGARLDARDSYGCVVRPENDTSGETLARPVLDGDRRRRPRPEHYDTRSQFFWIRR